jgi:hypothetical protein
MTDIAATERQFRRLLLAYPRSYRRRHGEEILTTLMEAADGGRRRPSTAEARDLVTGGLRQRLRLPVGRLMLLAAVLTALIAGGLGAGLGSLAGWHTAAGLPDAAAMRALAAPAIADDQHVEVFRQDNPFNQRSADAVADPYVDGWTPQSVATRLTAAGWQVDPLRTDRTTGAHFTAGNDGSLEAVPLDRTRLIAVRDGLLVEVRGETLRGGPADLIGKSIVGVTVSPARPAAAVPLTVAGTVLGLLAGWLLAARWGYRLRRLSLPRRLPALVSAVAAWAILAPLTVQIFHFAGRELLEAIGPDAVGDDRFSIPPFIWYTSVNAYAYITGTPIANGWLAAAGLTVAVVAILLAFAIRPASAPAPTPEPAGA